LLDIVSEMLRNSDNLTAELLAKSVDATRGGDTTIASSAKSVMASLSDAGFLIPGVDLRDSSGLDKNNRATCAVLADVLHGMGRNSDTVSNGLAIAGQTGTLSKRYNTTAANGRLRAKTGSIPGVAGLAGFVDPPPGSSDQVITYAFIVNNSDDGTKIWLEDNLVRILTEWDLHG
jgi:D-alanyl-D-alanine carboxypeptidase/D-alanyl-D-alanine-endopeptidase (penicillin-binding protein 4)